MTIWKFCRMTKITDFTLLQVTEINPVSFDQTNKGLLRAREIKALLEKNEKLGIGTIIKAPGDDADLMNQFLEIYA